MLRWDHKVFKLKQRILNSIPEERLTIVSPSKWMATEAKNSELLGRFPVKTIPYGLNTSIFRPLERSTARAALGLDEHFQVVGFIADGASDPRKGLAILIQALESMPLQSRPHLLIAGGIGEGLTNYSFTDLGRIENENLLRLFYSSLDLFICPSLQDNLPNTVLESISCGTPVIAFNIGGLSDMVRLENTGWLVDEVSSGALSKKICEVLGDTGTLNVIRDSCRSLALKEYISIVQARAYQDLYSELLSNDAT
jgi:glycosyltransferase involved in cell wall biosynthesis